jgi:hypothetical protein
MRWSSGLRLVALLCSLTIFLVGDMAANGTARCGAQQSMMAQHMPAYSAHSGTLKATLRAGLSRKTQASDECDS